MPLPTEVAVTGGGRQFRKVVRDEDRRNAPKADNPEPTRVTLAVRKRLVGAISEDPLTQIERIELNTPPDRCG
jgi:hypothetical protein